MTCAAYGVAISVGLALVLSTGIPAHSGMRGHGQMHQSESAAEPSPGGSMGMMMAGSLLMTVPVIIIFFFAQKYFIQGITLTGMKG